MAEWHPYNPRKSGNHYLIRFLSSSRLKEFLDTGIIWFSRADDFGDKMECVSIKDLEAKTIDLKSLEVKKRKHLISCWHNCLNESIAMWDTSFKRKEDQRVYAIKFNYDDLIKSVKESSLPFESRDSNHKKYYGRIRYKNLLRDNLKGEKVRISAFRKEYSFHYENEFRFVIQQEFPFPNKGYNMKLGNPATLKFKIMVNPLLEKNDYLGKLEFLKSHKIASIKHQDSKLVKWLNPSKW